MGLRLATTHEPLPLRQGHGEPLMKSLLYAEMEPLQEAFRGQTVHFELKSVPEQINFSTGNLASPSRPQMQTATACTRCACRLCASNGLLGRSSGAQLRAAGKQLGQQLPRRRRRPAYPPCGTSSKSVRSPPPCSQEHTV